MNIITTYQAPDTSQHKRPHPPVSIVIHSTESKTAMSAVNWFLSAKNTQHTCAHAVIDRDGTVYLLCDPAVMLWHAKGMNESSIGIEHVGYADKPDGFTIAQIAASVQLAAEWCYLYNIQPDTGIIPHSAVPGTTHHDPGPLFPMSEYRMSVAGRLADMVESSNSQGK